MIVIFVDNIENFVEFLENRLMNQVFYEFKETSIEKDLSSTREIEIILHFLSKVNEHMVLYETKLIISKKSTHSNSDQEVINALQGVFKQLDQTISLVKGKIREIFLSYSS